MFSKFSTFYRQFSQFSVRLLSRKFLSSTTSILPTATNSPIRRKYHSGGRRISGVFSKNCQYRTFTGEQDEVKIIGFDEVRRHRRFYASKPPKKEINVVVNEKLTAKLERSYGEESFLNSSQSNTNTNTNTNLFFPFLTGDELKAFDSSVYE